MWIALSYLKFGEIIMKLFNWFKKKLLLKTKTTMSPEDTFCLAAEEFNKAWRTFEEIKTPKAHLRPWLAWEERELQITEYFHTKVQRK